MPERPEQVRGRWLEPEGVSELRAGLAKGDELLIFLLSLRSEVRSIAGGIVAASVLAQGLHVVSNDGGTVLH